MLKYYIYKKVFKGFTNSILCTYTYSRFSIVMHLSTVYASCLLPEELVSKLCQDFTSIPLLQLLNIILKVGNTNYLKFELTYISEFRAF